MFVVALDENGNGITVNTHDYAMGNWCQLSHEYLNRNDLNMKNSDIYKGTNTEHEHEHCTAKKYNHLTGVTREVFRGLRRLQYAQARIDLCHKAEAMTILADEGKKTDIVQKSISVEDLIAHLQTLKTGTRIIIQEAGHYAQGDAVNFDMHDLVEIDGVQYHTLGCSEQFC